MKDQIIDYLQWTSTEYEDRFFLNFWTWCQKHGLYPSVIQQLLANAKINKWFMCEYIKCEIQFAKIAAQIPNNTKQLELHYQACTDEILAIYPKPIIDLIGRNRDFSNVIIINTPVYYAN
jgi:hypothetical protein